MKMLTLDDIKTQIKKGETRTLELKKSTGELKDGMHTACAFLNSDGGLLIFGVTPSLKIVGQTVTESTRREIAQALKGIEPVVDVRIDYFDIPDDSAKQLIVMHFDAFVHGQRPYTFRGCPYYKVESTTMIMPRNEYDERIRANRPQLFGWDVQDAYGVDYSDLDEVRIRNAVRLGVAGGRLNASAEGDSVMTLLNKFNLINSGKLSQAAVMLFAKESRFYPHLLLRMARFKGVDKNEFIDNRQAIGNFFDLLDAGMDFCFKHLNLHGKIVGVRRVETLEIPQEALREALINALCHRDYNNIHAAVSLAIYDDRVEIINPGTLPPDLSIEKLKQPHASSPRNLLIAQVLYRTTFIESWGSGVKRMTEVCVANGVKAPIFSLQDKNFVVTFYKRRNELKNTTEKTTVKTTEKVIGTTEKTTEKILRLLLEKPNLTNQELADKCGLTEDGIYYNIKRLKQKGLITRIGSDKSGYWCVVDASNDIDTMVGTTENTAKKTTEKVVGTTEKTTEKILRLLLEKPNLTNQELADKCGLTEDGIYYNIKRLKQKGLIARIGPDKGGYWQVNDIGDTKK